MQWGAAAAAVLVGFVGATVVCADPLPVPPPTKDSDDSLEHVWVS